MSQITEREFLTGQMYANQDPLAVRIHTHELYTQPPLDFNDWILAHAPWRGDETVLDIGCGSGAYIAPLCARLQRGGRLISGDLSLGMLRDVAAQTPPANVGLLNANVMHLPLPDACCDVALANHMLYHVPDIELALAQIRRVLRPGGRLLAATNAQDSLEEFFEQMRQACQTLGHAITLPPLPARTRFSLENGAPWLKAVFAHVERRTVYSDLVFPDAAPAVAYINSLRPVYAGQLPADLSWERLLAQVQRQIEDKIAAHGAFRVAKTTGVFIAC